MPEMYLSPGGIAAPAVFCVVVAVTDMLAIVDDLRQELTTTTKIAWALAIIFFPILGPAFYLLFGHRSARSSGRAQG